LFEKLEFNTHLNRLSMVNCNLEDEACVELILALVGNETIRTINIEHNPLISDGTGKALVKVLKKSNSVVKRVDVAGTSITAKVRLKLKEIFDERDEEKQRAMKLQKIQQERTKKIQELLAFDKTDEISPGSQRLSQRLLEVEDEKNAARSVVSMSTADSSKKRKKKKKGWASVTSDAVQNARPELARRNSLVENMAMLGGEGTALGQTKGELFTNREARGECKRCGQKLFQKTMFKTVPLNIPGKVKDGACLECSKFETARNGASAKSKWGVVKVNILK